MNRTFKWDKRFLDLAKFISQWSLDPSTKIGAVLVRENKSVISVGYNGFPIGVNDDKSRYDDRETKYSIVVHGEANAILFARESLNGATLYTYPFASCSRCAGLVIQSGIKRCVAPKLDLTTDLGQRWDSSLILTRQMFQEAGVILEEIEL